MQGRVGDADREISCYISSREVIIVVEVVAVVVVIVEVGVVELN